MWDWRVGALAPLLPDGLHVGAYMRVPNFLRAKGRGNGVVGRRERAREHDP